MLAQWYQEHLEAVVRENQQLKHALRKNSPSRVLKEVVRVFQQLFPEVPPLMVGSKTCSAHEVLIYYQRTASMWLSKEQMKLEVLMNEARREESVRFSNEVSIRLDLGGQLELRQRGSDPQKDSSPDLQQKIKEMSAQIKRLEVRVGDFQQEEDKYLKEIAELRSITKKLQFEVAVGYTKQHQLKQAHIQHIQQSQAEIDNLNKKIDLWRSEYEKAMVLSQKVQNQENQEHEQFKKSSPDSTGESGFNHSNSQYLTPSNFELAL